MKQLKQKGTFNRLREMYWTALASVGVWTLGTGMANAQAEGFDPSALLDTAIGWVKDFATVALTFIVIISFVVAAYAALVAVTRFVSGRGEWGGMFVVFLVALVVTVFVGQIAFEGQTAIDGLELGG